MFEEISILDYGVLMLALMCRQQIIMLYIAACGAMRGGKWYLKHVDYVSYDSKSMRLLRLNGL